MTESKIKQRIAELKASIAEKAEVVSRYSATEKAIKVVNNGG